MKIVKLTGGIGNQMFQYAFGKTLSFITGEEVLFDKVNYEDQQSTIVSNGMDKDGVSIRQYELDIFNLNIKFANKKQIKQCINSQVKGINLPKFFRKIFKKNKIVKDNIVRESPFNVFQPELFEIEGDVYYEGYFQCEKYFNDISDFLRKEFILPPVKNQYNKDLIAKIQSYKNSVAVHVRRGDYLNLGLENMCDISFYQKATDYIGSKGENPKFFVFCAEDPDWIKNNFKINYPFELIGLENVERDSYYENMRLMSICKHNILANSSYSWWAAWLNQNPDKIVIAPDPWIEDKTDHICESWVKIPRK